MNEAIKLKLESYCEWCVAQGGNCHAALEGCAIADILALLSAKPCETCNGSGRATLAHELSIAEIQNLTDDDKNPEILPSGVVKINCPKGCKPQATLKHTKDCAFQLDQGESPCTCHVKPTLIAKRAKCKPPAMPEDGKLAKSINDAIFACNLAYDTEHPEVLVLKHLAKVFEQAASRIAQLEASEKQARGVAFRWQQIAQDRLEQTEQLSEQIAALQTDNERLNWLDLHTAFMADGEYRIGPYKTGELRKMADDGIAVDKEEQDGR